MPNFFSNNMVLQRDVQIPVWGTAHKGAKVDVTFGKEKHQTFANADGNWEINLEPHQAGGDFILTVISENKNLVFNNITFGDVWLCGGQSNMEWYVERSKNAALEIEQASYPRLRLITVPQKMANKPQDDWEDGEWLVCKPETISKFSAVGYFFGRDLHTTLQVPIGLVNNNWGGTIAQTWMSEQAFTDLPHYSKQVEELKTLNLAKEIASGDAVFNEWINTFHTQDKGYDIEGKVKYKWSALDDYSHWKEMLIPGVWEGSGEKELVGRDGVVWFQKDIILTAEQAQKSAEWFFGPIDDSDKTWINGQLVGETYNKYNQERHYIIDKTVLKEGKNTIVIRVEDYVGGGGPYGNTKQFFLKLEDEKIPLSGTWNYKVGYLTEKPLPRNAFGPNAYPAMLFNGMIAPMIKMPIKGVIWYQGESNANAAFEYRDIFQRLIRDWRNQFQQPDLAFIYVQLANFTAELNQPSASKWAELREAQQLALSLDHTAMITAIDIGEAGNIHPENKQEVGRRLSLAALNEVYGQDEITYKGPVFNYADIMEKHIIIHFNPKDSLITKDKYGYLKGFTISGEDQVFHWAKAEQIDASRVKVWSDQVPSPKAVRYGWADNPQPANLFNKAGFPAFPFRTDDW